MLWCEVETRPCEVMMAVEFLGDRRLCWDPSGLTSCKFMYGHPSEFWEVNMVIVVGHSNRSRAVSDGVGGPERIARIAMFIATSTHTAGS
jgi:hypothetical protein